MAMSDRMKRVAVNEQEPGKRAKNFMEVCLGYDNERAVKEALRCLHCKNPQCIEGCPVSINIPEFISYIKDNDIEGAAKGKSKSTEIEDFLTIESIRQVISGETGLKRKILYALYIEEKSDAEVANQCQVSRQYVNRIRKKYASLLRKQLYEERS